MNLGEENGVKIPGRYYLVKFYNHERQLIMLFNGKHFEMFNSDEFIHDEIERWQLIEVS